jgi:outer membrane receptor protein involved in Fe transport
MIERSRGQKRFMVLLTILALCFSNLVAFAQSTATLQGTVVDPSGAVVPNAKVTVRNQATGTERTTQTDSDGNYQIAALAVGTYRMEIKAEGFQTAIVADLPVEVSQTLVQNFQLKVGGVTQEVNIAADAPVVETATTTVGQVINQKTVQEIPLNGRHFVDLGLLIPGSVTPPQNGFLTAPLRGQGSFGLNTAGAREDTVNFMINGINLNDMVQNQITFQPSINTVQEFKVDNSTFSAEYGRNSGAIANIATRSGGNQFHGEAFEFLRNDALDARNFFDYPDNPPFKRNQFGVAVGGPIKRDKTFFFFSYEGLRQRQGLTLPVATVPTAAQRAAVTDPAVKKLLDLIPLPNFGATGFTGSATAPVNLDQWTGDISHTLGSNDRLHGYYAFQRDQRGEPTLQGNTLPNFGDTRQSHRQIFTLNEVHTFGPNIVNEARLGFNRIHITFTPNAQLNPADFGINNGINQPIGLPQINVTGATLNFGGPNGFPQGRGDTTVVFSDTVDISHGRHSIKTGGEFRRFYNNNFGTSIGSFGFSSLNAFLAGTANAFTVTLGDTSNSIGTGELGFFFQDNFKLKANLTLELGLRYDWNQTPTERFNRLNVFDPTTSTMQQVGQGIPLVYGQNNNNVQPRLGFAWDPFSDGKTSVRGAYAILTEQPITGLVSPLSSNPPFAIPVALPASVPTTTFGRALSDVAASATLSPTSIDTTFDNPYVQSWNLNIQREVGRNLGITVGYFGSKGTHLQLTRNLNQIIIGTTTRPFPKLAPNSPVLPGINLANITQRESGGTSSYNALWVTANKRFSHGFQFNASYTFSKSLDFNSRTNQGITVQDSLNVANDHGLSDFDVRHRFVVNAIYELPFRGNQLVEGWQLSTIVQSQGGNPLTIFAGSVPAIAGVAPSGNINSLTGVATLRPDLIGPVNTGKNAANSQTTPPGLTGVQWLPNIVCDPRVPSGCPAGAWVASPVAVVAGKNVFHFGNLGRNALTGPGFNNVDFSVIKNTKVSEWLKVQFRAEFFDILNHANFGNPNTTAVIGNPSFGLITSTRFATGDSGSSRQVQFALKLIF